ncbi:MAG: putative Sensor histidine kinase [Verrucomicrobiales bacterium]|nr:putative Sensor histidine kinase [Verrucomicrobiales bacterium]
MVMDCTVSSRNIHRMSLSIHSKIASKPRLLSGASKNGAERLPAPVLPNGVANLPQSPFGISEINSTTSVSNPLDYFQSELLNHVSNAVVATDGEDRIVYWNKHAERLYQWSLQEVLGKLALNVLGQTWKRPAKVRMASNSGKLWEVEEFCKRKDGSRFKGNIIRSPIRNFKGERVGMVCVTTDISERKRAVKQLKQSKQQLRALTAHLQWAREKERTRIAREIHDELGQALSGIRMDLSWLITHHKQKGASEEDVNFRNRLQRIDAVVQETIQEVRRISTELRPRVLDELGLIAALEWQAKDFELRTGIPCCFATNVETVELDDQRRTAIFRIFQETLTNIFRHAEATRVNVLFLQRNQALTLEVQDNGKGVPARKLSGSGSLGLLGMRERAYLAKGSLEIHSSTRNGTAITACFPLAPSKNKARKSKLTG